ncbi:LysR family transcriptional regulator [Bordetella bronchialis]|uniref:LysR family transcriptional regulator n=1 Tax=Bordetella bronchialis TaxID=463025 RepID=A0A193G473_9BORD|nr:LysR family transcriptional regulator [Bordetella bronchialis]ANN69352.1 LysR family transcriptional regulator [Bordetella bronchialis]ANN74498.1 LysR family transcriptional regulator [Bordetella bronchialis]
MHPDPTSLRLFIGVIEEKTIAAAAEREHIAAAAVSKRMSELEEQLKTQLLVRTNKGIQPTNAGMALAAMARRALRELDDIAVSMREYASGARGFIRVFANISALTQFLPGDIQSFASAYPNIQLQLEEKISPAILKAVHENAADVGIFSGMPPGRELEVLPYRRDTLALIAPAGHPLLDRQDFRFADALAYDFVGLHTGSAINQIVANAADRLERPLRVKVQVTGFDTLCFMVDAGLGLGVLPVDIATLYARIFNIGILRIEEPWARRELQICVRDFQALPTAAKLFVEHLTGKGGHQTR